MSTSKNYRTLVISERYPFELGRNEDGTLNKRNRFDKVSATLYRVLDKDCVWIGWPGICVKDEEELRADCGARVSPVRLDAELLPAHDDFCCNLWGLLHLLPEKALCKETQWKAYVDVNNAFGHQALNVFNTDEFDVVWIHDYQLMLTALPIRQAIVDEQIECKLGLLFHAPFPSCDVFKHLPWNTELLQGMLASDVVAFQTLTCCHNFLRCCQNCLGCRVDERNLLIEHGGRIVKVRPLTTGIAFERFALTHQPKPYPNTKLVVTFDRCIKSVTQKLAALDLLLKTNREHLEKLTVLFVFATLSKSEVQEKIDKFNANYSTWQPVQVNYGHKTQPEMAALLQTADVCLITPFNNAVSLIAKEFVASQTRKNPGVLLLSSVSGNCEIMPEAITTNLNSAVQLAQALHRALTMPEDEKNIRMNYLRRREQHNNCLHWKKTFLNAVSNHTNTGMPEISLDYFENYLGRWIKPGNEIVLLLDYDGTLAPIMSHPNLSVIPQETKAVLQRLSRTPGCYVAIISGRGISNVKEMVGIEGITYAGNHGLDILFPDGFNYTYPIPETIREQVQQLDEVLRKNLCYDGAWVENKTTSLTFHYCDGPLNVRKSFDSKAKAYIEEAGLKPEHGHLAVEAKPIVQWNKGRAAVYILEKIYGTNWVDKINVIYAGDDVTDEDALRILRGVGATIRVTSWTTTKTSGERRVPNSRAVLAMLKWVEHYLSRR